MSELRERSRPVDEQLHELRKRVSALEDAIKALQRIITRDAGGLAARSGRTRR